MVYINCIYVYTFDLLVHTNVDNMANIEPVFISSVYLTYIQESLISGVVLVSKKTKKKDQKIKGRYDGPEQKQIFENTGIGVLGNGSRMD